MVVPALSLVGARDASQLDETVRAGDVQLSQQDRSDIDQILSTPYRSPAHRRRGCNEGADHVEDRISRVGADGYADGRPPPPGRPPRDGLEPYARTGRAVRTAGGGRG